jgi:signal peptidase II
LTQSRRIAAFCALAALLSNLVIQRLVMTAPARFVIIPGLADFNPAWNTGVSFSLFAQNSVAGCYLLIAILAVISIAVAVMAWRAASVLAAAGFGLVLGGALGNLWDRVLHCAVFDFLSLHLGSLPLFVCNFADIAISAGVILLAVDSVWTKPR